MTSTRNELLFSVHGMEFKFVTDSMALRTSVATFLHYFEYKAIGDSPMLLQFDAVERRESMPVSISTFAKRLYAGTGLVTGPERQTTWLCDIYSDHGLLIRIFTRKAWW